MRVNLVRWLAPHRKRAPGYALRGRGRGALSVRPGCEGADGRLSRRVEYQQAAGSSSVLYVEPEKLLVADEGVIEEPPPPPRRLPPPPPPPPGWLYGPDGRLIPCALGLFGICI